MISAKSGGDQTQKTMNMIMPIFIGWISIRFPSGLALYWVISNAFQMAQQAVIMNKVSPEKGASK
jgi:YidC/Oxa1 family membrane protein insertase